MPRPWKPQPVQSAKPVAGSTIGRRSQPEVVLAAGVGTACPSCRWGPARTSGPDTTNSTTLRDLLLCLVSGGGSECGDDPGGDVLLGFGRADVESGHPC